MMNSLDPIRPLPTPVQLPTDRDSQADQLCPQTLYQEGFRDSKTSGFAIANASSLAAPLPGKAHPTAVTSSHYSPWLINWAYPLGRYGVVPFYFSHVSVTGRDNLPRHGPVILAPTHRSRWDAIMVPYAAGYDITGRHLRFMVSADEVKGLQGWFIQRMGGFPINTTRPAIASLRHGVDLLQAGESLVIFPEGNIFREPTIQRLKPGLARLALQAEASQPNLGIQIVPISLQYSQPFVPWRCQVEINIGKPLKAAAYDLHAHKQSAKTLTADLYDAMNQLVAGDTSRSSSVD